MSADQPDTTADRPKAPRLSPFLLGRRANKAEVRTGDNPFPAGSPEHERWLDGWWQQEDRDAR